MKPLGLVIVGPTASGKSALAVKLAKKFDGEIISADSRQVYRGMNLSSGKITKREMRGVPHYLLDVVNPKQQFSVAQYQKLANKKIAEILKRGKLPIICGGTGFYIQSIVDNLILPEVAPNKKLRAELGKKNTEQLFAILKKIDPERAKNIDAKNPRRLIRAIEIAMALEKVPKLSNIECPLNFIQIGINPPPKVLQKKIYLRLFARIRAGMVAEARLLHKNGVSWKRLESFGLEYKYLALHLQKKITREKMLTGIERDSWLYAKRQLTWFKRDQRIIWLRASGASGNKPWLRKLASRVSPTSRSRNKSL